MPRQSLIGRLAIAIDARYRGFRKGSRDAVSANRKVGRSLQQLRREADKSRRELQRYQQGLSRLGSVAGIALGAGLGVGARGFLEFDKNLTRVHTLVGVSREQLSAWRDDIIALSKETAIPTAELAEGLFNLVSIGLEGQVVMESLGVIARSTAVGLGDFATTADTVTRVMSAYRKEGLAAADAADAVFATIKLGNDQGAEFVKVYQEVIKRAQLTGTQIQDFGAALSFLTTEGLQANRAGLGLNELFRILNRETRKVSSNLKEIGIEFQYVQRLFREEGLVNAIRILNEELLARGRTLSHVFITSEAQVVAQALADNNERALRYLNEFYTEAVGAGQRGFDALSETSAEFAVRQAVNEVRTIFEDLASRVLPSITAKLKDIIPAIAAIGTALLAIPLFGFFRLVGTGFRALFTNFRFLFRNMRATRAEYDAARTKLGEFTRSATKGTKEVADETAALTKQVGALRTASIQAAGDFTSAIAKFGLAGATIGGVLYTWSELRDLMSHSSDSIDAILETQDRLTAATQRYNRLLRETEPYIDPETGNEFARVISESQTATLEAARQEVEAIGEQLRTYQQYGAEAGAAIIELRTQLDALAGLKDIGIDISDLTIPAVREIRKRLTQLREIISNETNDQRPLEFDGLFAGSTQAAAKAGLKAAEVFVEPFQNAENILKPLQTALEDAQLRVQLVGVGPVESEIEIGRLALRRQIQGQENRLTEKRKSLIEDIAELEVSLREDAFLKIAAKEGELRATDAELAQLRAMRDVNTDIGAQADELIVQRAQARQQIQDMRDSEQELNAILSTRLGIEQDFARARGRGQREAAELIAFAEHELELAKARAELAGLPDSVASAEIAIIQERLLLRADEAELEQRIAEAKQQLALAEQYANDEAIRNAQFRIATLGLELESLEAREQALQRYAVIQREIGQLGVEAEKQRTKVDEFFDGIRGSVESSVEGILASTSSLSEGMSAIVDIIVREFLRLAVIKPLLDYIFGGLGSLFSGGGGSSSLIGTSDFQGLERGGLARRGLALVGEGGPELVDFESPGRVYTNDALADAIGRNNAPVITMDYTINSMDGPGVRRELERLRPQLMEDAVRAVEGLATRSNSRLSQALRR